MKKSFSYIKLIIILFLLYYSHQAFSQAATATWALTANANVVTTGNVTASAQTFGAGLTTTSYDATNGVTAANFNGTVCTPNANDYYEFIVTPSTCYSLTVTSITFQHRTSSPTRCFQLKYSVNGGAEIQIGGNISVASTTPTNYSSGALTITVPQGQYIRFRLYGATGSTTRTLSAKNFVVNGTTTLGSVVPSVTIAAVPSGAICSGTSVTFTATPVNGGITPSYQWKLNSVNVGIDSPNYTNAGLNNGDQIYCIMTSGSPCALPPTATSNIITMTVNSTPATPGTITGQQTTIPSTPGYIYSISAVSGATSYNWTVPVGWTITAGDGTTSITVTSGAAGQNGNITVTASNICGASAASSLAVSVIPPHNNCNLCHINHTAPGGAITGTIGNANLCINCHNPSGFASSKPFDNAMKAIPGTSGTSHQWDKPSVMALYETNKTTYSSMLLRLPGDSIICSTCHNQHTSAPAYPFLRESNAGDTICKNCHTARDVGRYIDNPSANKGSHPVGLVYSGTGSLKAVPTGSVTLPGGKIECSSCHKIHYATSTDGNILRATNDDVLCTSCHKYSSHVGQGCKVCHTTHNLNKSNIYLIKDNIVTPNSGTKAVVFTAESGAGSFADGASPYDGVCEVCHTVPGTSGYHLNNSPGTHNNGTNCTTCHKHLDAFIPSCFDCHNTTQGPRRQIVGVGGDLERTSHHVGTSATVSDCKVCHYMGTHKSGTVKLIDPDDGVTIYSYTPATSYTINPFCYRCHDANGSVAFGAQPFSDLLTPPNIDTTKWIASSHKTSASNIGCLGDGTTTGCHGNAHGSNKRNILAPYNYAGPGTGTDVTNEEEGFCLTCHGAAGLATVKVHLAFSSYTNTATNFYKHDPNSTYRKHDKNENTGAAFNGANRHIECVDCHNPHGALAGTATAPTLLPTMTGAKGVEPTYAGIGAPTGFTWQSSVTQEYQVCYKCHSSFITTLPSYLPGGWNQTAVVADGLKKLTTNTNGQIQDSRDMAKVFNPANPSFHPVMAVGINDGINAATFQAGWSMTSRVYCSSCHNNPNKATAGQGSGPHGSVNLHLLDGVTTAAANYKTAHNTGTTASVNEVCIKCHKPGSYNTGNTSSGFPFHQYHIQSPVTSECYTCHNSHGNEQYHLINFNRNEASCNYSWINGATTSQNAFVHAAGAVPQTCNISCHTVSHGSGKQYTPGSAGCTDCHNAINTPTANIFATDAHKIHVTQYGYACSTCHFNYGQGGTSEPTHPSGTENVNFDPNGLARRNGLDANTPAFNSGTKVCTNIYCHSTGNTADRGNDGTYTWGTLPFGTMTYSSTPSWDVGAITVCTSCHGGKGNMTTPYTILPGDANNRTVAGDAPATGSHQTSAHTSAGDINCTPTNWLAVQCFWCHNTSTTPTPDCGTNYQGTYGTSFHVDGQTYFKPIWKSAGGTMADGVTHSNTDGHCSNSKKCW